MRVRTFGRTGWSVGEVGYGMWGMGSWSGSDDDESMASLERAVDLGCNFFDTAWAYGQGRSERLLGRLLRSRPESRLYSATKIPPVNVARSMMHRGRYCRWAQASASQSTIRPSASALTIWTVLPASVRTMSSGR